MKELNLLEVVTATHTEELQHIAREEGLTVEERVSDNGGNMILNRGLSQGWIAFRG